MKQFKFNLQPVLDHKKRLHDKAQETYARAQEQCSRGEHELRSLTEEKLRRCADFKNEQQGDLDVRTLVLHLRYLTHLGRMEKTKAEDVRRLREEEFRCKEALIKMFRDKKTIEKLKDKRQREYLIELRAAEQKIIDETATGRFVRKARGNGEL